MTKYYNTTLEEFYNTLQKQDNKCAICGRELTIKACADHDHSTGKFRGILCVNCNTALGSFRDSVTILANAINYLERKKA